MVRKIVWKNEAIAFFGEFVGTTVFLWLGEGCIKTAQVAVTSDQLQKAVALSNPTILYIATSMGLALLTTAWVFYRITGGLFNPAISLALYLIGALSPVRAVSLVIAQVAGGIAGAGLVACMTPNGGVSLAITTLQPGTTVVQGLFIEALLTAVLVFTVLMLAAEKHKATYLAPIGIGLVLFVCQLFGTLWTGCGMNPSRALGPSVISKSFVDYHWIYHIGPFIGSLIAVFIYLTLKSLDYGAVVLGQDADNEGEGNQTVPVHKRVLQSNLVAGHLPSHIPHHPHHLGFSHSQRAAMHKSGMTHEQIGDFENQMVAHGGSTEDDRSDEDNPYRSEKQTDGIRQKDGTIAHINPRFANGNGHDRPRHGRAMASQQQDSGGISAPGTHNFFGGKRANPPKPRYYQSPIGNRGDAQGGDADGNELP